MRSRNEPGLIASCIYWIKIPIRTRGQSRSSSSPLARYRLLTTQDGDPAFRPTGLLSKLHFYGANLESPRCSLALMTVIAGEDANWGRVVMAVRKAGEPADGDRLSIWFGGIRVAVPIANPKRLVIVSESADVYLRWKILLIWVAM